MSGEQQYCPQCQEHVPTVRLEKGETQALRCQQCGYPIGDPLPAAGQEDKLQDGPLVLHIDDDPILRKVVSAQLSGNGFTALQAPDGTSGLHLAENAKPAVILLDVMLPDIDGYEVARQIRSTPGLQHVAIVMLTGTSDLKLNNLAFEAGADLAIRKPLDRRKLSLFVKTALQLRQRRAQASRTTGVQ